MKLYFSPGACSLSCRISIHEMGLNCAFEQVDLKTKQTKSGQDYLKIAPKGAVPALGLEGFTLTEGPAILQYLADTHKKTNVLPALGDVKRYQVIEWLNFITSELHKGASPLFNGNIPQAIKDEVMIPNLKKKLDYLDLQFAKTKLLMGDQYTVADGYLFTVLRWLPHFKIDLSSWKNVSRFYNEMKQRPAVTQSLKEEGIEA